MKKFNVNFSQKFITKFKKLSVQDKSIISKVDKTIELLRVNPFYPALKSHKIISKNKILAFSSTVSADIRIIWDYKNGEAQVLDILDIGGHSGKNKVYK